MIAEGGRGGGRRGCNALKTAQAMDGEQGREAPAGKFSSAVSHTSF